MVSRRSWLTETEVITRLVDLGCIIGEREFDPVSDIAMYRVTRPGPLQISLLSMTTAGVPPSLLEGTLEVLGIPKGTFYVRGQPHTLPLPSPGCRSDSWATGAGLLHLGG